MTHLTQNELDMLRELAKANPRIRLVEGVEGTCTCDGYGVELYSDNGRFFGVVHPKSAIDLLLEAGSGQ